MIAASLPALLSIALVVYTLVGDDARLWKLAALFIALGTTSGVIALARPRFPLTAAGLPFYEQRNDEERK